MKNPTGFAQVWKTLALIAAGGCGLWSLPAAAYVGPGAGVTMLGALWAVLLAVVLAVSGLLIWPIRALRRRLRHNKTGGEPRIESPAQEP